MRAWPRSAAERVVRRGDVRLRRVAGRLALRLVRPRTTLRPNARCIALTFDDGPDPVYTPAVLDRLRQLGVTATFFLVGEKAVRESALTRRILDEGHAIGSHSQRHPEPWRAPLFSLAADYREGRRSVERAVGRKVGLFRPPNGHVDARGALAMLAAGVRRPWLWTHDPRDWEPGVRSSEIVGRLDQLSGGHVVLLHDAIERPLAPAAVDRSATVDALDGIVALARAQNLRFVTLS